MANSLDAVSDRDYVVEFIAAASLTAVHLSRLAEEIVIWCSAPFRFIALSDAFTTGSSIMPQKRNPDAAELMRAKVGRIVGAFVALCTILKGLPLTYGKDMQEDKEPLFDAADSLELGVAAMTGMVRDLKANPERMRAVASADYSVATDLADWLVRKVGLPFRQAHHVTGRLVGIAADKGVDLDKLSLAEMQAVEPRIDRGVYRVLTVEASVDCAQEPRRHRARQRRARRGRGPAPFPGTRKRRGDELLHLQERRDARRRRGARHHRGPGRHAVLLLLGRRPARGVAGIRRRHQGHERRGLLRHEGQLAAWRWSACSASWARASDIVSVGEMRRALAAGVPAKRIIYSGVGKKASELMAALEAGVGQINVESSSELETLNAVAGQLGVKADITIRVNPDVDAGRTPRSRPAARRTSSASTSTSRARPMRWPAACPTSRWSAWPCISARSSPRSTPIAMPSCGCAS